MNGVNQQHEGEEGKPAALHSLLSGGVAGKEAQPQRPWPVLLRRLQLVSVPTKKMANTETGVLV